MLTRFLILAGSAAALVACLQSNPPDRPQNESPAPGAKSEVPLLLDPDGNPILEVSTDMLADLRKQMLEKGQEQLAKDLEAAYDFKTGKARVSASAPSK